MVLAALIGLFCVVITALVIYFRSKFGYWKSKNVLTPKNTRIPWGNLSPFSSTKTNIGIHLLETYQYFKSQKVIHGGIYIGTTPIYIPMNLDLIKRICIKDFNYFDEKGLYYHEESQPISAHMFQIGGEKWRRIRQKVSPTFTSGKLKGMFNIVDQCCHDFMDFIETKKIIDIKEVAARYTINVIGSCAFGLDTNCFKNESSEFYKMGRKLFTVDFKRALSIMMITFMPDLAHRLNIVFHHRDVEQFLTGIITETVRAREAKEVPERADFINLLLELKREEKGIEMQDIITQSFAFFGAGFETSAGTISHLLFETAQHPRIQLRMKEEIDQVLEKYDGKLTYEALQEMTYMSQVLNETLRKYATLPILNRETSKDYQVPDTNVVLEKGTKVFIPVLAIHWDEEYFPRPHVFDPDRFSPENKQTNRPFSWLAFGEGPRQCVGMSSFCSITKIALTYLFKTYNFKLLESSRRSFTYTTNSILSSEQNVILEKQRWDETNLEVFCEEERTILPNQDISWEAIYRLWLLGEIPGSIGECKNAKE